RELSRLEEDGWALLAANHFDEAEAAFARWREVDERPEPVRALFYVAKRRKDIVRAQALANQLLEIEIPQSPMWWRARTQRAEIAWQAGTLEAAEKDLTDLLDANPGSDLERDAWIKREAIRRARA